MISIPKPATPRGRGDFAEAVRVMPAWAFAWAVVAVGYSTAAMANGSGLLPRGDGGDRIMFIGGIAPPIRR